MTGELTARYDLAHSSEWQSVLRLFDFNQGFAFVVILVPDEEGADVCRRALDSHLRQNNKSLLVASPADPEALSWLAGTMLDASPPPGTGGVWVSGAPSEDARDYRTWADAWQLAAGRLNEHRNSLIRRIGAPLVFAGAPWLQTTLRDYAPDLWSMRTHVVRILPEVAEGGPIRQLPAHKEQGPDPEMALREAARLRGIPGQELLLARLLYRAGIGFAADCKWQEAADAFSECLDLRKRHTAPPNDLADAAWRLQKALVWLLKYDEAVGLLDFARSMYGVSGNRLGEVNCIMRLADVAFRRSDHEAARRQFQMALPLYRVVRDRLGEANCMMGLGNIALARSDHGQAKRHYEEALEIYREIGNRVSEANCLARLAEIALRRGDFAGARSRFMAASPLYRTAGHRSGEATCKAGLGDIALRQGEQSTAKQWYEEAVAVFRGIGDQHGAANCIGRLAQIALTQGRYEAARTGFREALPLFRASEDRLGESNCILGLGEAAYLVGDYEHARREFEAALPIYHEFGDLEGEANCLARFGDIARAGNDIDTARKSFDNALTMYRSVAEPVSIGATLARLARIEPDPAARLVLLTEALTVWEQAGMSNLAENLRREFPDELPTRAASNR